MARLLILFVVAFLVFVGLRTTLAKKNLSVKQFTAIYFGVMLGLALLFLAVTGRLHPVFALFGAVLPFLGRLFNWASRAIGLWQMFNRQAQSGQNPFAEKPKGTEMTRQEAMDILDLSDPICKDDVVDAHRKLMQKLHPDRGGSTYLAAQLNQAKELLLDEVA